MNRMVLLLIVGICVVSVFVSCGRWGKCPDDAIMIDDNGSIPGIVPLAGGKELNPFVWCGQILYEHDWTIYDHHGERIGTLPPPDSLRAEIPPYLVSEYSSPEALFTGAVDPAGHLLYVAPKFPKGEEGLFLYNIQPGTSAGFVEIVSLSALRLDAEKNRSSIMSYNHRELRERLTRAGCSLPPEEKAPRWNTGEYVRRLDYEGLGATQMLRQASREIRRENRETERFKKLLDTHLDSLQPAYEAAFDEFVAENISGAYVYTAVPYVVLPSKGFAFELTPGMEVENLPHAAVEPLSEWDKKQKEISIRRTGRTRKYRFDGSIPFIPMWRAVNTYYYRLTVGNHKWNIASHDRLQVFEYLPADSADGNMYLSLIGEGGRARLFSLNFL